MSDTMTTLTKNGLLKLVDEYANESKYGDVGSAVDAAKARAAVVAAIESLENKVTTLEDHITEITSEEHSIPELRQELIDQLEEKRKCYFAVSQYQKANQNLLEQVAALTKDAERLDWLDKNIFNRENLNFRGDLDPNYNMWVTFAPTGVQGSAKAIIDAAIAAQKESK